MPSLKNRNIGPGKNRVRQRHDEKKRTVDPESEEASTLAPRDRRRNQTKENSEKKNLHAKLPFPPPRHRNGGTPSEAASKKGTFLNCFDKRLLRRYNRASIHVRGLPP